MPEAEAAPAAAAADEATPELDSAAEVAPEPPPPPQDERADEQIAASGPELPAAAALASAPPGPPKASADRSEAVSTDQQPSNEADVLAAKPASPQSPSPAETSEHDAGAPADAQPAAGAIAAPPVPAVLAPPAPAAMDESRKQALIDRLHREAGVQSSKIATQQHEIFEQRAITARLQSELEAVRAQVVERERYMERLANDATNVDHIDLAELQRRHRMLAAAYRADRRRLEATEEKLHGLGAALSSQEGLQAAYGQLKAAHTQQAHVVQQLQEERRGIAAKRSDDQRRVGKYRKTVQQQELIIQKLEGLLEAAMKDVRRAKAQETELGGLRSQLDKAQADATTAKAEAERQRDSIKDAVQDAPAFASEEQVKLLMRAERAERRSAAIEEEMTEMARSNAREIAALKVKLAERDSQLAGATGLGGSLGGSIGGSMLHEGALGLSGPLEGLTRRPPSAGFSPPFGSAKRASQAPHALEPLQVGPLPGGSLAGAGPGAAAPPPLHVPLSTPGCSSVPAMVEGV